MNFNPYYFARIAFFIGWITATSVCTAQDVLLTQPPIQLRAFGTVCDENGKGIPNAELMWVVTGRSVWESYRDSTTEPETRSVKADDAGEFDLVLQLNDPLVLNCASNNKQLVLVQAKGFCTQVVDIKLSRLMIDLPFKFELSPCTDLELQVLSAEGNPIVGAQVKPAAILEESIPRLTPWITDAKTDDQGRVKLTGLELASLKSVYVESPTQGSQQVQITVETQWALAKLAQTGLVTGKLILSDGSDPKKLAGSRILLLTYAPDFQKPTRRSWQIVQVNEAGKFSADQLCLGQIAIRVIDDSFVVPYQEVPPLEVDESGNASVEIELKISPVQTEKIKFADESGNPLPGIQISEADGILHSKPHVTSDEGIYLHRWGKDQSMSGQLFPQDPLDCYQVTSLFGVRLDRIETKEGQPKSVRLTRSQALQGIAVDEKGNRLAGATISYSYASERFRLEVDTLSDSSGKFEIRGLPPSISVEVRASLGNLATDAGNVLSVPAGSPQVIQLVLAPQVMASPIGRVVDESGKPVSGAKITLQKGVVMQEEGYSGEHLNAGDIAAGFETVLSNNEGRFQFPAISNFNDRLKIKVEKSGFLTRKTPFLDGSSRPVKNQQIDLGAVTVCREPSIVKTIVEVVDQATGQPLPKTEVVFVGFLSGRQAGLTDAAGKLELALKNCPQVVAARSPDHQIRFEFLDQIDKDMTLRLESKPSEAVRQPHPWFQRDPKSYLAASRCLMDQLDLPSPTESTFFRQHLYFQAMAGMDLERLEKILGGGKSEYEHREDFLMYSTETILKQAPQMAVELFRGSQIPAEQRLTILSMVAHFEPNDDVKDELYGEASMLLNEMTGVDRLVAAGRIAQLLLLDDRVESAQSVIEEAWTTADEMKRILSSGEEKTLIAESRFYLPLVSILNLNDAIKLIKLTARQPEKESLLTEALLMHSLAREIPLAQLARDHKIDISTQDMRFLMSDGNVPRLAKCFAANLEAMPTSAMKVQAIFLAARHLPPGDQRDKLLQLVAELRSGCVTSYFFDDPAYVALREIAQFKSLQARELDEFTFACLKHAPVSFLNQSMIDAFGSLTKLLVFHDPVLARKFLQSAINVDGWHGGVEYPTRFSNNELLKTAAWIDPEYACELTETLAKRWDREGPTNKLQLYSDMIQALNQVRLAID